MAETSQRFDAALRCLSQAERDLEQAKASQADGRHEWACFAAQQAAEMAVKALHLSFGQEAWGHVVAEGAPFEHYGPLQSGDAIRICR